MSADEEQELQYFREYLRLPSVHPNPDYSGCIEFLKQQAETLKLPYKIYYPVNEQNPLFVMSWQGEQPELPAILLNSHMDVVPVFPENWTHPPFGAEMDEQGRIYARGAQDMKCVGMQHLGALRSLKRKGIKFRRTIHVSFVPDEEMGGDLGMRPFVNTPEFKALNVGFSLDEGGTSPTAELKVFYAERSVWQIYFHISGQAGHGSLLLENTAGEKIRYIIDKMMDMRKEQETRLITNPELDVADVTSINLTRLSGGVQSNVVPPQLMACFDVRLALDVNHIAFEKMLHKWCDEAGGGIELKYDQKRPRVEPTATDNTNPYWMAFKTATDELNLSIRVRVCSGGTDSRYIRQKGIPAIGFSPMNHTPVLLHDHDEFLQRDIYLEGIKIFEKIITKVANV